MKKLGLIIVAIVIAAILSLIFLKPSADIIVGSKQFTEQKILGEMVAQLIETNTNLKVRRRLGLQGTKICFAALQEADLDLYIEYTGTGLVNILKQTYDPNQRRDEILKYVRTRFQKKWNLTWLEPLGFANNYAFAMRKQHARKLGINKVSQLAPYVDELTPGFDHEYTTRPEFKQFPEIYGFSFAKNITKLAPDLTYKALKDGSVDIIDAFLTDGRIKAYDLKVLQDDKKLFPPYDACVLIRDESLKKFKNLKATLQKLSGRITVNDMQKLNYDVNENLRSPAAVATEFLKSKGLL